MPNIMVVLDACVLFPASLRDTLLRALEHRLYSAYWTREILEEVRRNLVSTQKMGEQQAQRLIEALLNAFPEAIVTDYQQYISAMMNHPKDRHVLAATVAAQATVLLTFNVRDFPPVALSPLNITAQLPDDFLLKLDSDYPGIMPTIILEQAKNLSRPAMTPAESLTILHIHVPKFVHRMREVLQL